MSRARTLWRLTRKWLRRGILASLGTGLVCAAAFLIAVYGWDYDVETLSPDNGGPLVIQDRHGQVLARISAPDGRPGKHSWVALDDVSAVAVATFLVSEDQNFFDHSGVDWTGIGRAAWLNLGNRRFGYGGSTITMQLVRMVHSAGQDRSIANKIKESVLAMRLERAMSKRKILEQYINRAYFGNGAYGIEAAAQLYFDKPAASLSTSEATLLAVLPRAPSAYDPVRHLERAIRRRDHVFGLLLQNRVLAASEIERAQAQQLTPTLHVAPRTAPHFVDWIVTQLPKEVRESGGVVKTTLDLSLQRHMERELAAHVAAMESQGMNQAGVVILDSQTGRIRAMVGSADYNGDRGQLNITTWRRHPGSALKPFVYASAIERGDSPATIAYDIRDVPSAYKAHVGVKEHGPARYRESLAGSYNLAAIHTLEKVGVANVLTTLRRTGLGPLGGDASEYGLRLALGSAKVRLLDMASAYGFLVREGQVIGPTGITEASTWTGIRWQPPRQTESRVFSPETSWLVMDMLADSEARRAVFGQDLPVDLSFPMALKTGTARGFADTLAIAVTKEITVAAWAGRFDGVPTQGLVAMRSAAPLVRAGFLATQFRPTLPAKPAGVKDAYVCEVSGMLPGPDCAHTVLEHFASRHAPSQACDWHKKLDGRVTVKYPAPAMPWAQRVRERGGRQLSSRR